MPQEEIPEAAPSTDQMPDEANRYLQGADILFRKRFCTRLNNY